MSDKPRIRVAAGRSPATARWLRDAPDGALSMRRASLVDSRDDIRWVWDRTAALAIDFIQNSGRLKGAVDQVLADTVGVELKLNARPDLSRLGYDPAETAAWARMVETRWRQWAWNKAECDLRGKFTVPQLVDVGLRHHVAYGEVTGVIDYLPPSRRRAYGLSTGVKLCLVSPHRLVRDTSDFEGLYEGVLHDANGRPTHYRFEEVRDGIRQRRDYPARDAAGRELVVHAFDPWDASDVRGISPIAAAMRTHAHAEALGDATLTTAILQTVFAATLTSPEPAAEVFKALEELEDGSDLRTDMLAYFGSRLEQARDSGLSISGTKISHLAPGEALDFKTAATPGSNYLPFSQNLYREMARCIGITYEAFTLDHVGATYSSTRMANASIWPIVLRRRERVAAPICQIAYENWLDEEIGEGRIPLKGLSPAEAHRALVANRQAISWAEWQGPAKPTADDHKSAKAATERLQNGTSTLAVECAELGLDVNDVLEMRAAELAALRSRGLPSPFERVTGGAPPPAVEATEMEAAGV